jgi:ferritin
MSTAYGKDDKMLSEKLQDGLNSQLNFEIYSSYIYLSMSAYLENINMVGAAHWMRMQAKEELFHNLRFFDYINDRDGRVVLSAIPEPQQEWASLLDVFEVALKHEQVVTSRICDLIDLAQNERDHVTNSMLQWFITEQIEEESNVKTIIDKIKMANQSVNTLYLIDSELGQRPEPVAPTAP